MKQHSRPIWIPFIFSPLAVPISISVAAALESLSVSGISGLGDLPVAAFFFFFLFGLPISYAAMLLFGLPYILALRHFKKLTAIWVCLGSTIIGAAAWTAYWQLSLRPPLLVNSISIGAVLGLIVGLVFCLVGGITLRSSGTRLRRAP